jgi:hypothetical protein
LGEDDCPAGLLSTVNVDTATSAIVCAGKASLRELQEFYSIRDMYDILEIISIENYNKILWHKHQERK